MPKKADRTAGVADATQDVQDDLRALREDLSTLAQEVTNLMSSTGNQTLDDVKDRIRGIRSALDEVNARSRRSPSRSGLAFSWAQPGANNSLAHSHHSDRICAQGRP